VSKEELLKKNRQKPCPNEKEKQKACHNSGSPQMKIVKTANAIT
jgi:hypothetical protein